MSSYGEKLRDPRWQKKRLEVCNLHQWRCAECGDSRKTLNVHHYWYEKSVDPWDYPDECYTVLCERCHAEWHEDRLSIDKSLCGASLNDLRQFNGLAIGLRCAQRGIDCKFGPHTDPLFVAAFVRGFWPPADRLKQIIDWCFLELSSKREFLFSEAIDKCVPDLPEYGFIHAWLRDARKGA